MKAEIVIYNPFNDSNFQIEVKVEDETVWLTQAQMVQLFEASKQNISLHIGNVFKEGELDRISTVKEYLTVQIEGGRSVQRKISYYNLDVIISVGYRLKSQRGTQFTNSMKINNHQITQIKRSLYSGVSPSAPSDQSACPVGRFTL